MTQFEPLQQSPENRGSVECPTENAPEQPRQRLDASMERDRQWRLQRRIELDQAVKRFDRGAIITAFVTMSVAPLIANAVLFIVRAQADFARSSWSRAFFTVMISILVMLILFGAGAVFFVAKRKVMQRELVELSEAEELKP